MSTPGCEGCADEFIVEVCDLASGVVRAVLEPVSMGWGNELNAYGSGTLTLVTGEVNVRNIWPHLASVYISRVSGGDATPENPFCEFGGMVESFDASDGGTTTVGLKSIDDYLNHRMLRQTHTYSNVSQNEISADLVQGQILDGIPLSGAAAPSQYLRDRVYNAWDKKIIGEALSELTQVINGNDWELRHTKTAGAWSTQMIFRDYVGVDRGVVIQSDVEAQGYSLNVDALSHTTLVDAMGSGEAEQQLVASSVDEAGIYPRFDDSPAWVDVTQQTTLQTHADGWIQDYREPIATPGATLYGLGTDPMMLRLGDTVTMAINYGAVTFNGKARLLALAWSVSADQPVTRTLTLYPIDRASDSVLNQNPTDDCPECESP